MAVQTFNETFLPNAKVPQTGSKAGAGPSGPAARAVGTPAIVKADGTANLNAKFTTHEAAIQAAPSSGKAKFRPAAVDTFNDGVA